MATQAQIDHITEHYDAFKEHTGWQNGVKDYFETFESPDEPLYERLCNELNLEPIVEPELDEATKALVAQQVEDAMASVMQSLLGGASEAAPTSGAEERLRATQPAQPSLDQALAMALANFETLIANVDQRDSEAALAMLEFLLKSGRLNRVGVLDGGQGYLFVYQEPKGSTKQGYKPGATQGDRIVDSALDKQRESGAVPSKRGLCALCLSAVYLDEADGQIHLDDGSHATECTGSSPDGKHHMA